MVAFVLLNPSTADEREDDPTIRRCTGYAKAWGYGGLVLGNIFAFRATDPKLMKVARDPVGPENDAWLQKIASQVGTGHLICGWGAYGKHQGRGAAVLALLIGFGHAPKALAMTAAGMPGHPLYLRADLEPFSIARP